ncbi:membrane protein [Rhodopirellula sallentina SM41]|uniref:Membrane protein n=2 Tax=Rhodopirellula TaxID=265488 RepID=M5U6F4_9BACT|nr:membrane protein [Rhodopirellula sallentina SM41]
MFAMQRNSRSGILPAEISIAQFSAGMLFLAVCLGVSLLLVLQTFGVVELPNSGTAYFCDGVLNGPYGPFANWPISFLSLAYFTGITVGWILAIDKPLSYLFCTVVRIGALASVWFLWTQYSDSSFCVYCAALHGFNIAFWFVVERSPRSTVAIYSPAIGVLVGALVITAMLQVVLSEQRSTAMEKTAKEHLLANDPSPNSFDVTKETRGVLESNPQENQVPQRTSSRIATKKPAVPPSPAKQSTSEANRENSNGVESHQSLAMGNQSPTTNNDAESNLTEQSSRDDDEWSFAANISHARTDDFAIAASVRKTVRNGMVRVFNKQSELSGNGVLIAVRKPFAYILTSASVVDGTKRVSVLTGASDASSHQSEKHYATVVAKSNANGLAILRFMSRSTLPAAIPVAGQWNSTDAPQMQAFATGHDGPNNSTYENEAWTRAVVRVKPSEADSFIDTWQLSSASSTKGYGGALTDQQGNLIGLATRIDGEDIAYVHTDEIRRFLEKNGLNDIAFDTVNATP